MTKSGWLELLRVQALYRRRGCHENEVEWYVDNTCGFLGYRNLYEATSAMARHYLTELTGYVSAVSK